MRLVAAVQLLDEVVMKNDLMELTRQALGSVRTPRDAKGAELLERAQAVIEAPAKQIFVAAPLPEPAPPVKLIVSIDGTTSRWTGWEEKRALHVRMIEMLPEQYEIALAAYHNDVDTFTPFMRDRRRLRRLAASIECRGGHECLPEVLARIVKIRGVTASVNVTDASAFCAPVAADHAEKLRKCGVPVFILLDPSVWSTWPDTFALFTRIAERTGGAVLPFDASGLQDLLRRLNTSTVKAYRHEF
jgi:hypothetical protein